MTLPVLEVKNVTFSYGRETVLEDVNLTITEGEFVGLVGPNGSGKTTLIKCILGLLTPQRGHIRLFGRPITTRERREIGYVSQKANSFNVSFPATVFEIVATGLYGKLGLFKRVSRKERLVIDEAIDRVGLTPFRKQLIGQLSGGQQQRAFIAKALVSRPRFLILDEPTVGVDSKSVEQFYHLLEDLRQQYGLTILLVSHDIGVMTSKVTKVACLNKRLYFHGSADEFRLSQTDILSLTYGHDVQLLEHHHEWS